MDMFNSDFPQSAVDPVPARALTIALYRNLSSMKKLMALVRGLYCQERLPAFTERALQTPSLRIALSYIERLTTEQLTIAEYQFLVQFLVEANLLLREAPGYEDCALTQALFSLEQAIMLEIATHFVQR